MSKTGIVAVRVGDRFTHPTYEDAMAWLTEHGYRRTDTGGVHWTNDVFVAKLEMEDPEWVVQIIQ